MMSPPLTETSQTKQTSPWVWPNCSGEQKLGRSKAQRLPYQARTACGNMTPGGHPQARRKDRAIGWQLTAFGCLSRHELAGSTAAGGAMGASPAQPNQSLERGSGGEARGGLWAGNSERFLPKTRPCKPERGNIAGAPSSIHLRPQVSSPVNSEPQSPVRFQENQAQEHMAPRTAL